MMINVMTIRPVPASLLLMCLAISAAAELPKIKLEPFLRGLERPTFLISDGTDRLFITEQPGRIRLFADGKLQRTPFLDIEDQVQDGGECGLLSMAFHPKFSENGYFYVNFTTKNPTLKTVIAEFKTDPKSTMTDVKTARVVMTIDQPFANHNGGQIAFGPDGMLYIGMGDGGSANDPQNNAQNPKSLLGKMLRIDVNTRKGYEIPKDNPLINQAGARGEIWAGGLRNPWRFSFDRKTGVCYAADVGQDNWEEIDIITKGANYGWRVREGLHPTPAHRNGEPLKGDAVEPIAEYDHSKGLSITGGYVYRGKQYPALDGWYFYADFSSGRMWALQHDGKKVVEQGEILKQDTNPSSFGEDADGELYLIGHGRGQIWKIVATQ